MKYTKQDFDAAIATLVKGMRRPELYSTAFWLLEDYAAIGQFLVAGIISQDNAESEYDRLTEEAIEEAKKLTMKQAGVMLIINQGMILGISRRHDKTIFGLLGGKFNPLPPDNDKDTRDAAIRETKEETSLIVKDCEFIYERVERVELGDGPEGVDYYSRCYYATSWLGIPTNSEEGEVKWLTAEEVTSTKAAFGDYNRKTLDIFKSKFPNVYLKGE